MSRAERIAESRTARKLWVLKARYAKADGMPVLFAQAMRKARFHHRNLMITKLAEWA